MSESDVPQVITRSARSIAAQKRWEKKRMIEEPKMEKKKFDWSLLIAAGTVVVPVLMTVIGCYVSLVSAVKDVYVSLERTKSELSKEIALVRSDLSQEISKVRSELSKDIDSVRLELSKDMGSVRLEMAKTNSEIDKIKSVLVSKELVNKESFVRKEDSYL